MNPQGASYFENIYKKCHLPSLTNMDDIFYYHVWISIFEVEDQTYIAYKTMKDINEKMMLSCGNLGVFPC
jgi:hypothetical protein